MLVSDVQIRTQKASENETWRQARINKPFLFQDTQQAFKMESLIDKNSSLDLKVSFFVLPMALDRPKDSEDAKVEAPSMQSDILGYQKSKICLQKNYDCVILEQ